VRVAEEVDWAALIGLGTIRRETVVCPDAICLRMDVLAGKPGFSLVRSGAVIACSARCDLPLRAPVRETGTRSQGS